MKRQILVLSIAALMIGATATITSCVKNDESESVKSLRDAKTMQLKSIAEMNMATAQATIITANSKAALDAAQAKYYQAQAAMEAAQAKFKDSETAANLQALEEAKLEFEKAKATAQLEIDAAVISAKAAKTAAQTQYDAAFKAYEEARANMSENPYLDKLMANYKKALTDTPGGLFALTDAAVLAEANLVKAKAGLVTAEELLQSTLDTQNAIIASNQAQIAVYEALPQGDRQAAKAAVEAAKAKLQQIHGAVVPVADKLNATASAGTVLSASFTADKYAQVITDAVSNGLTFSYQDEKTGTAVEVKGKSGGTYNVDPTTYVTSQSKSETLSNVTFSSASGVPSYSAGSGVTVAYDLYTVQAALATAITTSEAALKAAKKAVSDAEGTKTTAKLQEEYATALAAWEAAGELGSGSEFDAKEAAKSALETRQDLITVVNAYTAQLAALEAYKAASTKGAADFDAYTAKVKAVADAKKANTDAKKAFDVASDGMTAQGALISSLEDVYDGYADVETLIADCKTAITTAEATIESAKSAMNGVNDKQAAVLLATRTQETAKTDLANQQAVVDALKAKIDAQTSK